MYQGKYSGAQNPPPRRTARKKRRSLFYPVYVALIALFFVAMLLIMVPLRAWLVRYEASQPDHKRDEIFTQLFVEKNWEKIYDLAVVAQTPFEDKSSFCAYMDSLVAEQELTCLETSAGLSGGKKYLVKLGSENLAVFTLKGGAQSEKEIPNWELDTLQILPRQTQGVIVERLPGQTVYINGIALDDSYTVKKIATQAEEHLPQGVHGFRLDYQQVVGLLTEPSVTVKDGSGNEVPVAYDLASGIYTQHRDAAIAEDWEKDLALGAVKVYSRFLIKDASLSEVAKRFDKNSDIYETIRRSEVGWAQTGASFRFSEPEYFGYYRYSDGIFSMGVKMSLLVTRTNGTIKEYPLYNSLVFTKGASGTYLVTDMTNTDIQTVTEQVKLTFINGDTVLDSFFISADANTLTLPQVTVPEGQVMKGWVKRSTEADGKTTLTVVFSCDGTSGEIHLPSGSKLEPMTLYPYFQDGGKTI